MIWHRKSHRKREFTQKREFNLSRWILNKLPDFMKSKTSLEMEDQKIKLMIKNLENAAQSLKNGKDIESVIKDIIRESGKILSKMNDEKRDEFAKNLRLIVHELENGIDLSKKRICKNNKTAVFCE